MTPKEKADELMMKFWELDFNEYEQKTCALIVVNEVLTYNTFWDKKIANRPEDTEEFWNDVREELEKL